MAGLAELGSQFLQDLRYAARSLKGSPGFTVAAVLTIGLGVGINTGIFSLVNDIAFSPLPAYEPDRLVALSQEVEGVPRGTNNGASFTRPEYESYRDRTEVLSSVLAYGRMWTATIGGDVPQTTVADPVSCNFFDVLGVAPEIGGGFSSANCENSGEAAVAVIGHDLWLDRFGGDRAIIGRTVTLNGIEYQIVGVAPEGFTGIDIDRPSVFVPISARAMLRPDRTIFDDDVLAWLNLVGRLAPGVSMKQAEAELSVFAGQLDLAQPGRSSSVSVSRATRLSAPDFRIAVLGVSAIVMTGFGLILLVACMNVANLMLARADSRMRDTAIRLSLGATRGRLVRQFVAENVLIAIVGGTLGAMLAVWAVSGLVAAVFSALPPEAQGIIYQVQPRPDAALYAFAFGLSVLAGVGSGLAPALMATRPTLRTMIDEDAPGGGTRKRSRLQGTLVGLQVALCMILVVATALLLRGFYQTQNVDPGFDYEGLILAGADMESFGYAGEQAAEFQRRAIDEIRAIPGVEDVAQTLIAPLEPRSRTYTWRLPEQADTESRPLSTTNVSANYFAVTRIPIVRGRAFTDGEVAAEQLTAAILTESTARSFWPDEDPIGKKLVFAGFGDSVVEVVGIAKDIEISTIGESDTGYMYVPAIPRSQQELQLVIRARSSPDSLLEPIGGVFQRLDPRLPARVRRFEDNFAFWAGLSRVVTAGSFMLGALALVLASIGVFGVMTTVVGRRVREIGIRLALGAGRGDVLGLMLRKSMRPVVIGAAVGVLACFGVAKLLSALLFGVGAFDLYALVGAAAVVLGAGFVASAIPARRALNVDPMTTLRYE